VEPMSRKAASRMEIALRLEPKRTRARLKKRKQERQNKKKGRKKK